MEEHPIAVAAIRKRMQRLPHLKLVAFSAACCECLLPHYATFVDRVQCGDVTPLRTALDRIWDKLAGESISPLEYYALSIGCLDVVPDPEGFSEAERRYAERAQQVAEAIRETFVGCAQRSREQTVRAARLALDALALRLITPGSDPGRSATERLDARRQVRELSNQLDVIAVLEMVDSVTPSFLARLRQSLCRGEAPESNLNP